MLAGLFFAQRLAKANLFSIVSNALTGGKKAVGDKTLYTDFADEVR